VTASLLPIPDDPRFGLLIRAWPEFERVDPFPRSLWLGTFEDLLREFYPSANSRSLSLTARSVAPFPLRDGKDVP
jgi:hypothetical protein